MRAFYSTTEEISALFAKQQEQLKAMQKTLEDEDNYANTLMGVDLNDSVMEAVNAVYLKVRDEVHYGDNTRLLEIPPQRISIPPERAQMIPALLRSIIVIWKTRMETLKI